MVIHSVWDISLSKQWAKNIMFPVFYSDNLSLLLAISYTKLKATEVVKLCKYPFFYQCNIWYSRKTKVKGASWGGNGQSDSHIYTNITFQVYDEGPSQEMGSPKVLGFWVKRKMCNWKILIIDFFFMSRVCVFWEYFTLDTHSVRYHSLRPDKSV